MKNAPVARFEAVPRRRLTEEIAHQIEQLILSGELRVGDRLPPERELAAQLQVSRNILREAVSVLAQKGLVEVQAGSGTYVTRPGVEFLSESLEFFIRFNTGALLDLIEARRPLEVEIARLAAERATEEDCQILDDCLRRMERHADDPEMYVEADIRFHESLAKATHNSILELLLNSIRDALGENIRTLAKRRFSIVEEALKHHRLISQAVAQHDPDMARLAMREHLESVTHALRQIGE